MRTRIKLVLLAVFLVTGLGIGLAPQPASAQVLQPWYRPRVGDERKLIMAHQGGEGEYPSNTNLAFTQAKQNGADALDTDMLVTKDGVLVLFHDETLEYRTNGTGYVHDKTYSELLKLDFAYNWTPDGGATYPYRGQGIKVSTVKSLLTVFPTDRIGIEIKQVPLQAAKDLCTMIKQYQAENRVLVSSSTQPNMDAFRTACPTVATSATQDEATQFFLFTLSGFPQLYQPKFTSLQIPEQFSGITVLTPSFVTAAHNKGIKVYPWTIDTPEQAQRLINMGVDGLNTSYPKRIITWLHST